LPESMSVLLSLARNDSFVSLLGLLNSPAQGWRAFDFPIVNDYNKMTKDNARLKILRCTHLTDPIFLEKRRV
ncbi:MAG: hypothetical protein ACXWPG_10370, partial [Ktedonobacteraceae bacterium]